MGAPLMIVGMYMQVGKHVWIVTLGSIVRVTSFIVGEMRKQGFAAGTVIIVGKILYWGILHAVALRVDNMLCTISRTWQDVGAVWMAGSCHWASVLMAVVWYYRKYRPCNEMVEEYQVRWQTEMRDQLHPLMKRRMYWSNVNNASRRNGQFSGLGLWCGKRSKVNRGMKPWTGVGESGA